MENQIELLEQFCIPNGWTIHVVHADIALGLIFEKRKEFFALLLAVMRYEVERVVITSLQEIRRRGLER